MNFVPILTEAPSVGATLCPTEEATIEIEPAGAVVRVGCGLDDAQRLTAVLRAVHASISGA